MHLTVSAIVPISHVVTVHFRQNLLKFVEVGQAMKMVTYLQTKPDVWELRTYLFQALYELRYML